MEYDRQIVYIDLIEDGIRKGNAGFVKWETNRGTYRIEIRVKGLYKTDTIPVEVRTKDNRLLERMQLVKGEGTCLLTGKEDTVGYDRIPVRELCEIHCVIPGGRVLRAQWRNRLPYDTAAEPPKTVEPLRTEEPLKTVEPLRVEEPAEVLQSAEKEEIPEEKRYESKWERLCDMFDTVHPFGDERTCVKITPGDFYLFRESYQHLAGNSFLLHGYYNYHYLILGKKEGNDTGEYLLGVPGVYYDREVMAAKMFGFEGFEGSQRDYGNGSFGYYMITVE